MDKALFWGAPGGVLLCDTCFTGFQKLTGEMVDEYGKGYVVGESISVETQREIARFYRGSYTERDEN